MKVHQMKALSQLGFLRTPFQSASQAAARPTLAEDTNSILRKVPSQLLFDLELDEGLESRQSSRPASAAISRLEQVMLPFSESHSRLVQEAEQAWGHIASRTRGTGTSALADALKQIGYEATPRIAVGSSAGGAAGLQNLCHRFVSCSVQDSGAVVKYVVDPHFREQFEIARPTSSYRGLLAAIPDVVVLPEEQMSHLVQMLCHELGECFKQLGETIPPWRRPASMASKWQSRHSLDGGPVSMTADSSTRNQAAYLARATAAPTVGELSKRLPSSRRSEAMASSEIPGPERRAPQLRSRSMQPAPSTQPDGFESTGEGNHMMADMRRLLAFY